MSILFFRWADWRTHTRPRADRMRAAVSGASTHDCPRCNPTARAMDYVRHQWIAAGIDRE